ncbi:hypothetical protein B0T09DRAFT_275295, partial [Sordaria sp. MPI-SDFR-AT-0083]
MMLNSTTSPTTATSNNSNSIFDDNRGQGEKQQQELTIMRSIFNPPPPAPMEGAVGVMAGLVGHHPLQQGGPYYPSDSSSSRGPGSYSQTQASTTANAAAAAASRRNKPSYGMVFSQMLDLHLLCTKVPRGRSRHGSGYGGGYGGYVWAVEVLLDELGIYEGLEETLDEEGGGKRKGLTRRSREQRWGAVEIEKGSGRVVDTFK